MHVIQFPRTALVGFAIKESMTPECKFHRQLSTLEALVAGLGQWVEKVFIKSARCKPGSFKSATQGRPAALE